MAIFHLNIQIITRGKGKSAVAAAAYRAGEKLTNEYEGELHDYTRKGGVTHTEIILPDHAPREFLDRSTLWNSVEKSENQKNSQLAREMNLAFPYELTAEQNLALVRRYVQENFVNVGMCADVCIHEPDHDTPNPHAHIMLTMRPLNLDGSWGNKVRKVNGKRVYTTDWNERSKAEEWRAAWATAVNEELKRVGSDERIDHRSYQRQGVDKIPTVHLGVSATQMERKGIQTERGDLNREIAFSNSQLKQLRARIGKTKVWLDEQRNNTPPTLYAVLNSILDPNAERSHYKQIADLKLAAKTLVFIQQNHISDLGELADKVRAMHSTCNDLDKNKKKIQRRIDTLGGHLRQSANFKKYRGVNSQYEKLSAEADTAEKATGLFAKSKAEKAHSAAQDYYRDHDNEIKMFRDAEKYLRGVLQKRYDPKKLPPTKAWEKELADKTAERDSLNRDFYKLRDEIKHAETLKRFAADLMIPVEPQERQQQRQITKSKGIEL